MNDQEREQLIRERDLAARERDAWRLEAEFIAKSRAEIKAGLIALEAATGGSFWRHQGDGEDHPESLTCHVVMDADSYRDLMAAKDKFDRLRDAVSKVVIFRHTAIYSRLPRNMVDAIEELTAVWTETQPGEGEPASGKSASDDPTSADRVTCPYCGGEKKLIATGIRYAPGHSGPPVIDLPCRVCDGKGTVDGAIFARIERGNAIRQYRIDRCGLGLREAADKWNIRASTLSYIEQGISEDESWWPPGIEPYLPLGLNQRTIEPENSSQPGEGGNVRT